MTSIFVFVPAFGQQITATTFLATHALMPALNQRGIGCSIATLSHPDIADLRNMALSVWYESMPESTHLLFVDADMGFQPQLVIDMLAFGEPMVGGIYRKRNPNVEWAASGLGPEGGEVRGPFCEVEGLGMGCFLLRRDAADKMIEGYPDLVMPAGEHALRGLFGGYPIRRIFRFFDPIDAGSKGRVSEDISFCRRWRAIGGKVWGASHHNIQHVGPFVFQGSYHDFCVEEQAKGIKPAALVDESWAPKAAE